MSDDSAIAETAEEPFRVTLREFLETIAPLQSTFVGDTAERLPSGKFKIELSEIELYCDQDRCKRKSIFRPHNHHGNQFLVNEGFDDNFVKYLCSNCRRKIKSFALRTQITANRFITIIKYGEIPADEEPTPPKLLRMFDSDRELYFKGRSCEKQGLGIGAAAYYRRVVENQKDRLFDEIIRVGEKVGAKEEILDALRAAKKNTQFTSAIQALKVPESLLISRQNPLTLLHRLLSRQVHEMTDEECLNSAHDLRVVLVELAHKIGEVLKDQSEVSEAVNRIMAAHATKSQPKPKSSAT